MNARLTLAAALASATATMMPLAADAATYWPWCSLYGWPSRNYSCAFASKEQCMETISGIGGICYANPYPNPYPQASARPAKLRRHVAR